MYIIVLQSKLPRLILVYMMDLCSGCYFIHFSMNYKAVMNFLYFIPIASLINNSLVHHNWLGSPFIFTCLIKYYECIYKCTIFPPRKYVLVYICFVFTLLNHMWGKGLVHCVFKDKCNILIPLALKRTVNVYQPMHVRLVQGAFRGWLFCVITDTPPSQLWTSM